MKDLDVMLIAGEPSGDLLAAELVTELQVLATARERSLVCFGAGGPRMKEAGVDLAFDMTAHAVIGLWEAIKGYFTFRRLLNELLELAIARRPDVIVCVDFGGFNSRFVAALRDYQLNYLAHTGWKPKIVQYVSPQVWASRPGRADAIARDFDQLLCVLPFEKQWWNERQPDFPVEFVGHPIVGRHRIKSTKQKSEANEPLIALMPGSRAGEIRKHLPVLIEAAQQISQTTPARFRLLLPNEDLSESVQRAAGEIPNCTVQIGDSAKLLREADLALTKTGTITLECALYGLPAITFYKTSPLTYEIGKRVVNVPYLTMPNLLAGDAVYPEFVQDDATAENLAQAVIKLLVDVPRQKQVREQLGEIVAALGDANAPKRAAESVLQLLAEA
jgi:lipid-A-disaccharide synthase